MKGEKSEKKKLIELNSDLNNQLSTQQTLIAEYNKNKESFNQELNLKELEINNLIKGNEN